MMDKILSVSIAAYNVEKTLEEALLPFMQCKQKEKLDVMIVDDGSKDRTAEVAMKFIAKEPNVFRLISKENGGWGSTLNAGMLKAQGKYFKQLDGDDYYSYENLDDFISFLEKYDADIVYSPFVTFDDKTGGIIREIGVYDCFPHGEMVYLDELSDFAPAMHDLTVRTEILKKNNIHITEKCFYTDVEFVLKSCNYCITMYYYDRPIYYYRIAREGQSMSITGVRKHYKDHQKMLFTMLNYLDKEVTRESIKRIFYQRLSGACTMQYIFYMALPCNAQNKKDFREFDATLKNKWPKYYKGVQSRGIAFLRRHNFRMYFLVSHVKMMRDKKLQKNLFER